MTPRYRIARWIGSGGLADVFEAADHWTGETVVIKRMRSHWRGDRRAEAHFVVEACALRRLAGGPVAALRGEGVTGERLRYLVLERADGVGCDAWLDSRPSIRASLSAFARVIEVVEVIHRLGVLHGDLKPGNVMLAHDPARVALIDFGLAAVADLPGARPRGLGTPEYLAPELVHGSDRTVATEIYALGAILYELLAGVPPFPSERAEEILWGHLHGQVVPPSLRTVAPIARALEDVALRALAKRAGDRFPSVAAMRTALVGTSQAWPVASAQVLPRGWDHLATIPSGIAA